MAKSVWRPVVGHEGTYWISPTGAVKNKRGKVLSTSISGGIRRVYLYGKGQRECKTISEMLIETYPEMFK